MRSRKNYTSFLVPAVTIFAVALAGCQGRQHGSTDTAANEPGGGPAPEKGAIAKTVERRSGSLWSSRCPPERRCRSTCSRRSSKGSHPGDAHGSGREHVLVGGTVRIPAGSSIRGTVTEATPLKKIGGRAKLGLSFTSVEPPSGAMSSIQADYHILGKSETKKDTATIVGSTIGGAIIGRVLGHKKGDEAKGTAVGAAVGAAGGTAAAAITKGHEVVLPAGKVIAVELDSSAQVTVKS
jgi:hypothetical protein